VNKEVVAESNIRRIVPTVNFNFDISEPKGHWVLITTKNPSVSKHISVMLTALLREFLPNVTALEIVDSFQILSDKKYVIYAREKDAKALIKMMVGEDEVKKNSPTFAEIITDNELIKKLEKRQNQSKKK